MTASRVALLIFAYHFSVASSSFRAEASLLDDDAQCEQMSLLQTKIFADGEATEHQRREAVVEFIAGFEAHLGFIIGAALAPNIALASFIGFSLLLILVALWCRHPSAEECFEGRATHTVETSPETTIPVGSSPLNLHKGKENEGKETKSELSYLQCWLLVSLLVFAGVYDVVLKFKALDVSGPGKSYPSFDLTSILLVSSVIVAMQALVALWLGGEGTSIWNHHSLWEFLAYCPSRFAKVCARILSFWALYYVAPDVFKGIDNSGLLATAVLHHFSVKPQPSPTVWALIVLICMAGGGYAALRARYTNSAGGIHNRSANGSPEFIVGMSFALLQAVLRSFCDVDGERLMKKHKDTPLAVQKLYQETLTILFCLMLSPVAQYAEPSGAERTNIFDMNFFRGWGNPYVIALCAVTLVRSWLSAMAKKKLTSITKRLCANCGSTLVYFAMLIHACPTQPTSFVCPAGIRRINATITFANFGILILFVLYVFVSSGSRR